MVIIVVVVVVVVVVGRVMDSDFCFKIQGETTAFLVFVVVVVVDVVVVVVVVIVVTRCKPPSSLRSVHHFRLNDMHMSPNATIPTHL